MISKIFLPISTALCLLGCVDQYGRVVPPDPIGRALVNALDPAVPVYRPQEYIVSSDMPAVRYEQRGISSASYPDSVWVNGYWGWSGGNWVWIPGRWVQRPRPNVVWTDGEYYVNDDRRYWRSGYWR